MEQEACCICASLFDSTTKSTVKTDAKFLLDEKAALREDRAKDERPPRRQTPCCQRYICGSCLQTTPRFASYCPYCQISTSDASSLPSGGLRDPPSYTSPPRSPPPPEPRNDQNTDEPPTYDDALAASSNSTNNTHPSTTLFDDDITARPDLIHHLHTHDTLSSLAISYRIPSATLRTHNSLYSKNLFHARHTLSIPLSQSSLPLSHFMDEKGQLQSLSPKPVDSEEERERKAQVRRFMVGAKCKEYEIAELYLGQARAAVGGSRMEHDQSDVNEDPQEDGTRGREKSGDVVERALAMWRADEEWEKKNPLSKSKGKGKKAAANIGLSHALRVSTSGLMMPPNTGPSSGKPQSHAYPRPAFKPPRPVGAASSSSSNDVVAASAAQAQRSSTSRHVPTATNPPSKPLTGAGNAKAGAKRPLKDKDSSDDLDSSEVSSDDASKVTTTVKANATTSIQKPQEAFPEALLSHILHSSFAHRDSNSPGNETRMTNEAMAVLHKYVEIFAKEAIHRAEFEKRERIKEDEKKRGVRPGDGVGMMFLDVEDLERLVPQLLLDF
ncbi:MAG: hypothetical protein M1831_000562 [Alyxoria varia]|nr:MAG: hypothetical protein M1831_000562 [Alyxoria varia]